MNQRTYGFLRLIPTVATFIFAWSLCFPGIATPAMPRASSVWTLPFSEPFTLTQGFAPPDKPWLSGSRGIWVNIGSEDPSLRSPCNGTVVFSGMLAGAKSFPLIARESIPPLSQQLLPSALARPCSAGSASVRLPRPSRRIRTCGRAIFTGVRKLVVIATSIRSECSKDIRG